MSKRLKVPSNRVGSGKSESGQNSARSRTGQHQNEAHTSQNVTPSLAETFLIPPLQHARKENDSFIVVKAAIEHIIENSNKDITWIELRKHKVPFATRKIGMLCNRVSELHFMKPDQRKIEQA